jgi:hypothetical protein
METWIMIEGKWMHIVVTFDGNEKKTYIDGELWSIADKLKTEYTKCFTQNEVQEMYNKGVDKH